MWSESQIGGDRDQMDRRLFERFSARFPVKFKDTRDDFGANVSIRDASAQGLRITSRNRLFIHDSVSLEIKLPDGHPSMIVNGEVVWAKPDSAQNWDVGVRFHKSSLVSMSRLYRLVS